MFMKRVLSMRILPSRETVGATGPRGLRIGQNLADKDQGLDGDLVDGGGAGRLKPANWGTMSKSQRRRWLIYKLG